MLRKLINTGVSPELSFKEQSKIRVYNSSLLTVSSILILYSVVGLFQGLYLGTVITAAQVVFFSASLWLMHSKKHYAAYHTSMITGLAFLLFVNLVLGEPNQAHLYFLFMPVAATILFDNKRTILFYFFLSILLLMFSFFAFKNFTAYYPPEMAVFGIPNLFFTGLIIFLGIMLFKSENTEFNEMIHLQKKMLEEKNKDITDSIQYARRIQKALLASDSLLKNNLPEHFILYKPKDIVSGDFYWASPIASSAGPRFLIATCDCTGHGVPGAFMSLLGISFLNEIIKEERTQRPDLILNSLREQIIKALNPDVHEEKRRDGMDAVLCSFDFQSLTLDFSCANNPLWILRNGQWMEFKPDKFPVGPHEEILRPFTLKQAQLRKGDIVYTFTDGYADQFGGPKGKKFKYKKLKEKILQNSSQTMNEQRKVLNDIFDEWKGTLEQVDDILLIGIKI